MFPIRPLAYAPSNVAAEMVMQTTSNALMISDMPLREDVSFTVFSPLAFYVRFYVALLKKNLDCLV